MSTSGPAPSGTTGWELVVDGIDFGEGPRWHLGRLWFSDFYQGTISSVGHDHQRRVEVEWDGRPSGLGWLPDGRLLFVSMLDRRVMRREADGTVTAAADDLSFPNGSVITDDGSTLSVGESMGARFTACP